MALNSNPRQFDIVGGYEDSPVNLFASDFRTQFDGAVFVDDTSPSRLLDSAATTR